ncbi:MAG: SDR family NAD(P)-dependent oxidoreductase [Synergistaceae bacterium]|nr:SDR family NAD(P)-dependent oxidoreductase [Synergistaceae bacterium]
MSSITGLISSPAAAVYSAAKAGLCRFIESVNIELECSGSPNRILNVAPGFIDGTKFYGRSQANCSSQLSDLAEQILGHLLNRDTLFIPKYDEIYKGVIERYRKDPHEFGLSSYDYKQHTGRLDPSSKVITGYMSGTFDLFHVGHLNIIKRAKSQCDYLVVGVHNNGKRKGKETFIPLDERKRIVASCRYVDRVIDAPAEDSDAWPEWHYSKLFVGSDYKGSERFNRYEEIFAGKGVEIVYFPYTQTTSSTQIRKAIEKTINSPSDA